MVTETSTSTILSSAQHFIATCPPLHFIYCSTALIIFALVHQSCLCADADVFILLTPPTEVDVNFCLGVLLSRTPSVVRLFPAKAGVLPVCFLWGHVGVNVPQSFLCQNVFALCFKCLKAGVLEVSPMTSRGKKCLQLLGMATRRWVECLSS